jgi:hypothetical protein
LSFGGGWEAAEGFEEYQQAGQPMRDPLDDSQPVVYRLEYWAGRRPGILG